MCGEYKIPFTQDSENFLLYTTGDAFLRKFMPEMTTGQRAEFVHEFKWREIEAVKEKGRLYDGILEMLGALADDNIEMSVCGMGSKEYIDTVIGHCGITKYFKAVYCRVDGLSKAQVVRTLLLDMKLEYNQCMMVGDSITDLTAARVNRVPFIGVSYGYGAESIPEGIVLINDITQLQAEIYKSILYSQIARDISMINKPVVIGISGVDTAGKTTFAQGLDSYLKSMGIPTALLHADDFHNPRSIRYKDASPEGYLNYTFDVSKIETAIRELRNGTYKMTVELLDLDTDIYTNKTICSEENAVIIVEGVLLFRPPLVELFDYKIFLDVSFDEVLRRAMDRDAPKYGEDILQRYKMRYIPAQKLYLSRYFPKEHSQMVIDCNNFHKLKQNMSFSQQRINNQ